MVFESSDRLEGLEISINRMQARLAILETKLNITSNSTATITTNSTSHRTLDDGLSWAKGGGP